MYRLCKRNKAGGVMKPYAFLILSILTPLQLTAEVAPQPSEFKERAQHAFYGTAKLAFVAANLYAMYYSADSIYSQKNNFKGLSSWLFDYSLKPNAARWSIFRELVRLASCGYVSYRCTKSAIHSFCKAFEKENVIKRAQADDDEMLLASDLQR